MNRLAVITALFLFTASMQGQNPASYKQMISIDRHSLSPATGGYSGNSVLISDLMYQWLAIDGAPEHFQLSYSAPLKKELYATVAMSRFKTGNFNSLHPSLSVANHIRLSKYSKLLFGLKANYLSMHYNSNAARTLNDNDPVLAQAAAAKTKRLYFGAGVSWQYKDFNIGLFSEHLTGLYFQNPFRYSEKINGGIHAGYEYNLNKGHKITAGLLMQTESLNLSDMYFRAEATWSYNKTIFAGLAFGPQFSPGFTAGTAVSERMLFFYSFNGGTSAPSKFSNGTHALKMHVLLKRNAVPESFDPFPVTESEKEIIRSEKMQREYRDELEKLKQHFNQAIYEYDKRIKELEEKLKKEGL